VLWEDSAERGANQAKKVIESLILQRITLLEIKKYLKVKGWDESVEWPTPLYDAKIIGGAEQTITLESSRALRCAENPLIFLIRGNNADAWETDVGSKTLSDCNCFPEMHGGLHRTYL
jgi:hypothetical protein